MKTFTKLFLALGVIGIITPILAACNNDNPNIPSVDDTSINEETTPGITSQFAIPDLSIADVIENVLTFDNDIVNLVGVCVQDIIGNTIVAYEYERFNDDSYGGNSYIEIKLLYTPDDLKLGSIIDVMGRVFLDDKGVARVIDASYKHKKDIDAKWIVFKHDVFYRSELSMLQPSFNGAIIRLHGCVINDFKPLTYPLSDDVNIAFTLAGEENIVGDAYKLDLVLPKETSQEVINDFNNVYQGVKADDFIEIYAVMNWTGMGIDNKSYRLANLYYHEKDLRIGHIAYQYSYNTYQEFYDNFLLYQVHPSANEMLNEYLGNKEIEKQAYVYHPYFSNDYKLRISIPCKNGEETGEKLIAALEKSKLFKVSRMLPTYASVSSISKDPNAEMHFKVICNHLSVELHFTHIVLTDFAGVKAHETYEGHMESLNTLVNMYGTRFNIKFYEYKPFASKLPNMTALTDKNKDIDVYAYFINRLTGLSYDNRDLSSILYDLNFTYLIDFKDGEATINNENEVVLNDRLSAVIEDLENRIHEAFISNGFYLGTMKYNIDETGFYKPGYCHNDTMEFICPDIKILRVTEQNGYPQLSLNFYFDHYIINQTFKTDANFTPVILK